MNDDPFGLTRDSCMQANALTRRPAPAQPRFINRRHSSLIPQRMLLGCLILSAQVMFTLGCPTPPMRCSKSGSPCSTKALGRLL